MKQKLFVAGKALIVHDGKILLVQEDSRDPDHVNVGRWDIPGGRLDFGEHPLDGLKREVREETGLTIDIIRPFFVDHWMPKPYPDEDWQIVGIFYECDYILGDVVLSHEHKDFKWVHMGEIEDYEILPASKKALEIYTKISHK